MTLDDYIMLGALFDIYGALLTERQQLIVRRAVIDDCSLFEIADELGISRQAVRDALLASKNKLVEFDSVLGLSFKVSKLRECSARLYTACAGNTAALAELDVINSIWKVSEVEADGI